MKPTLRINVRPFALVLVASLASAPISSASQAASLRVRYDTSSLGGGVEKYDVPATVAPPACTAAVEFKSAEFAISMSAENPSTIAIVPRFTLFLRAISPDNFLPPSVRVQLAGQDQKVTTLALEPLEVTRKGKEVTLSLPANDLTSPKFWRAIELVCH